MRYLPLCVFQEEKDEVFIAQYFLRLVSKIHTWHSIPVKFVMTMLRYDRNKNLAGTYHP